MSNDQLGGLVLVGFGVLILLLLYAIHKSSK